MKLNDYHVFLINKLNALRKRNAFFSYSVKKKMQITEAVAIKLRMTPHYEFVPENSPIKLESSNNKPNDSNDKIFHFLIY